MRGRTPRVLQVVVIASVLMGLLLADSLRLFAARPSPESLIRRLQREWDRAPGYQADISVGSAAPGSAGPRTCRQWYQKDGVLVMATRDLGGFMHLERWQDSSWTFFHPGAKLNAAVEVRNLRSQPFARWYLSGFPTVDELVACLTTASSPAIIDAPMGENGLVWVLQCTPPAPESTFPTAFRETYFSRAWTVWLSDRTGLPIHVQVGDRGQPGAMRIGLENLRLGRIDIPEEWRGMAGSATTVRRRLTLTCDAGNPGETSALQQRLAMEVDAWRTPLLRRDWDRPVREALRQQD